MGCTQERSQSRNKAIGMKRLKSHLLLKQRKSQLERKKHIKGDSKGLFIVRNYVLHPYTLVKDNRVNWESTNVKAFLDGGKLLEDCINCLDKRKNNKSKI